MGIVPLFSLGRVVATGGALKVLVEAGQLPHEFLGRHVCGDWGDLDEHDIVVNNEAVLSNGRILSAYTLVTGIRICVITESDRSATTIILPADY